MNKGTDISHMLTIADLHNAAPGVLDVVTGPDGSFEGAPRFTGPILVDGQYRPTIFRVRVNEDGDVLVGTTNACSWVSAEKVFLDLRIPSVAARLAWLCARAGYPDLMFQDNEVIAQAQYGGPSWNEAWAVRLAALTLALAPRIRDLDNKETR